MAAAKLSALLALTLLACSGPPRSTSPGAESSPAAEPADPVLLALDALLEDARRAHEAKDAAAARAGIAQATARATQELAAREDAPALELLERLGRLAHEAGDNESARRARERVLEVRTRISPPDDPHLQRARLDAALTRCVLGDFAGGRELAEQALEACSRTLPDDHPDLQRARASLAAALRQLGELDGARALFEKVLEVRSRTLPEDHPDLQRVKQNLASTLYSIGDLRGARALFEQVIEVRARTLPEEHPDLQVARLNLASTLHLLGDIDGARALEESIFAIDSRTLPDDHPELQRVRQSLAASRFNLGDLAGARMLQEKALEVRSRTLPDDHPDLQSARRALAGTMRDLGDHHGAKALLEKAVEVLARTLPEDHPELRRAWMDLAATLDEVGEVERARQLFARAVETCSRTLSQEHPDSTTAAYGLAATLKKLGDHAGARALEEEVLETRSRTLPEDHHGVQEVRRNLAWTLAAQIAGVDGAPAERPDAEEVERLRARCADLLARMCASQTSAARAVVLEGSSRETEACCARLSESLSTALSFAEGLGVFDPVTELEEPAFVLSETTRAAALSTAALVRRAAGSTRWEELRGRLRERSDALATLVQEGATSESFRRALAEREEAEEALVALAREIGGDADAGLRLDLEALRRRLGDRDALIAYRRFTRWRFRETEPEGWTSVGVDSLCAFVVRASPGALTRVDLGPIEPIEAAVRGWRARIGTAEASRGVATAAPADAPGGEDGWGDELRRLAFDPLREAVRGADRLVLVLDDALHLVPLDALPAGPSRESGGDDALLGDRLRIETRVSASELLVERDQPSGAPRLLVLGGVDYGAPEGSAGFSPLPATLAEAEAIAECFAGRFGGSAPVVRLTGAAATRGELLERAPHARWLHVATHGWFASDSVRSWSDAEPLDRHAGLGFRASGEEQVRGTSPLLLCGLALAGANGRDAGLGRSPGRITAEEVASLDLTRCELAVLSACDTNVGERTAGQGVASLQKALQMAGARSVVTSLWKVPDEATRELMADFYRRVWIEGTPKGRALWEAKRRLRDARDERGRPRYATRDWGAWVLTGEPD